LSTSDNDGSLRHLPWRLRTRDAEGSSSDPGCNGREPVR
jgi:hypothetical protein